METYCNKYTKSVPVIVLMAMNPSLLSSSVPTNHFPLEEATQIETLYNPETSEIAPNEMLQSKQASFKHPQSKVIRPAVVLYQKDFKAEGKNWTMYYTNERKAKSPTKHVLDIYLVPETYVQKKYLGEDTTRPPAIAKLVYHDLGGDKDFVGALIKERIEQNDGSLTIASREIRLPDEIADEIMDLLDGTTKFTFNPQLEKTFEVVKTAKMQPPKGY